MKKNIIVLIFLLFSYLIFCKQNIPLVVESEKIIFKKLSSEIKNKLSKKIEIVVYNIVVLNETKEFSLVINNSFKKYMKEEQKNNNNYYYLLFFDDIKNEDNSTDYSFVNNYNEHELIAYAKYLNKDAIFISSLTIFKDETKDVFDIKLHKFVKKNTALIQGNIFNTDTQQSILRFRYYFLID
ncbi:MAG: hypothetical protein A2086_10990 [Spirochaetes bacterium GWD1_27_9]|nr:MAG: hypothetical protein A2Z98_17205 [Spirochaetes bacterium GWB1_27_13]OHD22342.1 MAG: hypothetical protein A2Y34_06020 [Spirochaetes bacterium GWC1_27_15]OHD38387.1 MAG: hypothetical protein A2086_10990 [Spirochaetes bacterium GWD1_27_9]